jgi:cytidylate kinase
VSLVARMPEVRSWVNERVREAAAEHDVVVDGRDIGTAVFPDARSRCSSSPIHGSGRGGA